MKRRVFNKKLTRSLAHERDLLSNMASSLILHGRVETTVTKAKVLQHRANKLIEWAKRGTNSDQHRINHALFMRGETIPQLQLLAARFKDRTGGYTRLTLNGFRPQGTDRAPLAIVEYIDGPRDTRALIAKQHLGKIRNELVTVQSELHKINIHSLRDPLTGAETIVRAWAGRSPNLTFSKIAYLTRRERVLQRQVEKMEKSLVHVKEGRSKEEEKLEVMFSEMEARHKQILRNLEAELKVRSEEQQRSIQRGLASFYFSSSPLVSPELAQKSGLGKRIRWHGAGRFYWHKQKTGGRGTLLEIAPDSELQERMERDKALALEVLKQLGVSDFALAVSK
ncbi:ribosomal protein L17 [Zopfochytrium polystomum]|nr:ribosomal protein L17 [Zopfochytrium polystomum]